MSELYRALAAAFALAFWIRAAASVEAPPPCETDAECAQAAGEELAPLDWTP